MTQVEIAFANLLTVVAIWQAQQEGLTENDREQLITSLNLLGEKAGIPFQRMAELALEIRKVAVEQKNGSNLERN